MWYSLKLGLILISGTWLISNLGNSVFIDTQGQAAELYFFPKDIQSVDDISAVKKVVKSASSLSKTIIQGTCFDEYIYCGEFISMCDQEEYEELMSRHCSLTCGRCDVQHKERETCEDYAECEGMSPLCNHHIYKETVQKQCRKTCGICKPDSVGCEDRHKNCKAFKDDGFCENPIYSTDERSYLCGTTCGLCQDSN
ncbi:hypothetical protein FO519_006759 [Halicephalobus sp. NKZ332]|nr:hypothetical protein FO519_006759 [Halicephalobus sp. NKZ332]